MINHISLTAILKEIDSNDDSVRYIEVVRNYKDNKGQYQSDRFPCRMWNGRNRGSFFLYKEGTIVAIDGRVENDEEKIYIIVECVTFMFKNETEVNLRAT